MMKEYREQIERIKNKLEVAKETDKSLKVFGARSHKYRLGPVLSIEDIEVFEKKYQLTLPECYRAFLTHVGNGGDSYDSSAAGPFYGIYPLGAGVGDILDEPEPHLSKQAILFPDMLDEEWKHFTNMINDDDISDDEYERELERLYAGVMPIGSQGCTYLHALIVTGKYRGRVVNIDMDQQKPVFAYEATFLDWYERWLDEIIAGWLLQDGPSWFGYSMGGDAEQLLAVFNSTKDRRKREDALYGFAKLDAVSIKSCEQLLAIAKSRETNVSDIALKMLCRFSYSMAIDELKFSIESDDVSCLNACQSIFWYAKEHAGQWSGLLKRRLKTVNDPELLRFITYLLQETDIDYGKEISRFCQHERVSSRVTAFHYLGQLSNKSTYIEVFLSGLRDESPKVVHATLQALNTVKDKRLLEAYREIIERFPIDEHSIHINLEHRLQENGYKSLSDFMSVYDDEVQE
ncbi:SMI1/KNR4 family protein [Pleionea sp. CnH1-48]|uniref:SMI1/KNR4 family protein n=1 Tax=Pleionea sp. CnH1-48 TaxID=2954494 RepID=UPI002097CF18|nr:SMI1/KNR4 family protein [Pleionea sp. CnH1-48]MCO7223292.1 SMI1/KNR4 family protein [Pleionea sp. CnH1-48]